MAKKRLSILFVCTGNSARSQMAEGFARAYASHAICIESAGTNPVGVNPSAVRAMNEVGIDISQHTSDLLGGKDLQGYDYVVTLCGEARDACPVLPPQLKTEHWPLPDPARIHGTPEQVVEGFRVIRYQIEHRVHELLSRIGLKVD